MGFDKYNPPADKVKEAQEFCRKTQNFGMRLTQELSTLDPEAAKSLAKYYSSVFNDGAIKGYMKELMFVAIGVSHCSPACLIHVTAAINGGASDDEIFEAASVGANAAGFVPNGPGIPYAFQYAKKVIELAMKFRSGDKNWDSYLTPPKFPMD